MLSSTQWDWLKEELAKEAEITVIVSGVQVKLVTMVGGFSKNTPTPPDHEYRPSPLDLAIIATSLI